MDNDELTAASNYFKTTDLISNCSKNEIIIGRYSMVPFYFDQQREIQNIGAKCINSYNQHLYVSDLGNYVVDLNNFTPRTWNSLNDLPDDGPFILKGETNSRKFNWKQNMFANNKKEAIMVSNRLVDDSLIGQQKIYIRQYIPLFKYMDGINGMPVTKEFRFFIAFGQILSGGYYWQNYIDDIGETPSPDEVPKDFLQKIIEIIGNKSNFYTIDVAQTETGDWIVIELNEGQQSGLSCNDPYKMYENLSKVLKNHFK